MDKDQYIEIKTNNSFVKLDKTNKVFSFNLYAKDGHAKGYCDLTESEYEAFEKVFERLLVNAKPEN